MFEKQFALVEVNQEHAVFRYPVLEEHYNAIRVVHGGVIAALLDTVMGVAVAFRVRPLGCFNTAATLTVSFFQPVREGEVLAEGRVLRLGKRIAFTEATATLAGVPVAHATATFAVIPLKPGQPHPATRPGTEKPQPG